MKLLRGCWEIEIAPRRGGRISSLRLDGAELLDQGIGVDIPDSAGFVAGGAQGWDELVPTVDAASWKGVQLPDHGEAWRLPWNVDRADEASCAMSCEGTALPWRLERRLSVGESVRADYRLTNRGEVEIPAYWCGHPLFRYEAEMEVDVGVKLMGFGDGKSAKLFLVPGAIDAATLRWPHGPAIELAWDRSATPYCAVWICNGDLGGYRQVAIEPATGGGDRPDSDEPPPLLGPGASIEWWLEVRRR